MHLVVQRTVRSRMMSFGDVIKKVRTFTIKYRQSPKAKAFLFELYQRRLPGFIDIRWSVFFNLEFFVLPFLTRWSELLSMKAYQELAEQPGDLPGQLIKHMKWDKPPNPIVPLFQWELPALAKYVSMMSPIKTLFSTLNSETRSTLHLVYPTLLVRDVHIASNGILKLFLNLANSEEH